MLRKLYNLFMCSKELKISDFEYVGGSSMDDLVAFRKLYKAGKLTEDEYNNCYMMVRLKI